jgi:hypothetical protein
MGSPVAASVAELQKKLALAGGAQVSDSGGDGGLGGLGGGGEGEGGGKQGKPSAGSSQMKL